jgi:hypothetical protein
LVSIQAFGHQSPGLAPPTAVRPTSANRIRTVVQNFHGTAASLSKTHNLMLEWSLKSETNSVRRT